MAFVILYVLPLLLAFVIIPKQSVSVDPLDTDDVRSSTDEDFVSVNNAAQGQESRSSEGKTRHGHRYRKAKSFLPNTETAKGEELASGVQETRRTNHETTADDGNDDAIDVYDDVIDNNDEEDESDSIQAENGDNQQATISIENENIGDDEITGNDDAIVDDVPEIDASELIALSRNTDKEVSTSETDSQKSSTHCSTCTSNTATEKEIKIELVKQQLLQKLGLSSAPKVDDPLPPLPFDFYVGEDFSMNDDADKGNEDSRNVIKTREIFIFGKDITDKCAQTKSTGCYSFDTATSGINPDMVSGVELWIYKQPDVNDHHIQEFMVSELEPYIKGGKEVLRFRNIVKRIDTRLKYGWMKIYVKRSVVRWLSKPHRNHGLAVVCKTCQRQNHKTIYGNKEGYMPILVFYMKQHPRSLKRNKRHVPCIEGGMNCCHKEQLEINFRDIGWNYIMTPETIRPNFCTGSCNGVRAAYYNHTRLMQSVAIESCCSPVSFASPQSLLYRDNHGNVRKVDVPDLIVGECGCM